MNTETLQHRLELTPDETILVRAIIDRGLTMARAHNRFLDVITTMMDISFCHKLHCPMRLREWLDSDHYAFAKDFTTIVNYFDREKFVLKPDAPKLHFARSNESRIIVPENISLERHFKH